MKTLSHGSSQGLVHWCSLCAGMFAPHLGQMELVPGDLRCVLELYMSTNKTTRWGDTKTRGQSGNVLCCLMLSAVFAPLYELLAGAQPIALIRAYYVSTPSKFGEKRIQFDRVTDISCIMCPPPAIFAISRSIRGRFERSEVLY